MPNRKKILYVVTKSIWGGAQRYVHDLATHLPPDRYEPVVAAGGDGLLHERLRSCGIRTIPTPFLQRSVNPFREAASLFYLLKIFLKEKPDVIHLNSPKAGLLGALAASLFKPTTLNFKPRVVYTVHGWPFHEDRIWIARLLIFIGCWFSALLHDHIILINKKDFETASHFLPHDKLTFVPNGIEPPDFLPRDEARAALESFSGRNFRQNIFLIGTIAELTKNKGLMHLIKAIDQVKLQISNDKFQTIIIGNGIDRAKLEKEIRDRDLENMVLLPGFIPDVARYLKAFDLFVLPSVKEGLPYAMLEAVSAGVPIIATRVGGLPDIISDSTKGVLVPPKNASRLAETILQSMQNPISRPTLDNRFSIGTMTEATQNLYT